MLQPPKTANPEKLKKLNFLEELYQTSERKNLYLKDVIEKLQEELKLLKERNEILLKEAEDLKQENQSMRNLLSKYYFNHKDNKDKNFNITQSKISINAGHGDLNGLDYKTSNFETTSTNDQSVIFESRYSIGEKPLYSLCRKDDGDFRKISIEQKEKSKKMTMEGQVKFQKNIEKDPAYYEDMRKSIVSNVDSPLFNIFFGNVKGQNVQPLKEESVQAKRQAKPTETKPQAQLSREINFCQRIFEEFFVIGVDEMDISKANLEKEGNFVIPEAKILYSYPDPCEKIKRSWIELIPQYVFPFGVNVEQLFKTKEIQNIIFSTNISNQNEKSFLFLMRSEDGFKRNKLIQDLNPNQMCYAVCFLSRDYIEVKSKNKRGKTYYAVPRVFCFVTYFPMFKFFIDLIVTILNSLKNRRVIVIKQNMPPENEILSFTDASFMLKEIHNDAGLILEKIYKCNAPLTFEKQLFFEYNKERLSFSVPKEEKAFLLESKWGSMLCFSNTPFEDLFFLFIAILLETKVVFLSKNPSLLTSTIMAYYALMKPFKWPHPIFMNLPQSKEPMLGSPVPILIGINQDYEYFQQQELDQRISNAILVDLDDSNVFMTSKTFDEIFAVLPNFGTHKEKLKNLYMIINKDPSQTFPSKSSKKNFVFGFKKKEKSDVNTSRIKKLIYDPNSQEENACEKILEFFRECLYVNIVKKIPPEPKYIDPKKKNLDFDHLERQIINSKQTQDQPFLQKFLKTVVFREFLMEFYQNI